MHIIAQNQVWELSHLSVLQLNWKVQKCFLCNAARGYMYLVFVVCLKENYYNRDAVDQVEKWGIWFLPSEKKQENYGIQGGTLSFKWNIHSPCCDKTKKKLHTCI